MSIPTEPIGSIPRPAALQNALAGFGTGKVSVEELNNLYDEAVKDTVEGFEAAGSTVFTDGEQTKSSFATYPLSNITNLAPDGVEIPFEDGHKLCFTRQTALKITPRKSSSPTWSKAPWKISAAASEMEPRLFRSISPKAAWP